MQVYVCVICKVVKPPLYVLTVEHRQMFEAIVSSAVNIAKLKKCRLLACVDCQRLMQTVLIFQQTALVGVRHLLNLLSRVEQKSVTGPDPLQMRIKKEMEETANGSLIEIEVEPEQVATRSEVSMDLKLEADDSTDSAGTAGSPAAARNKVPAQAQSGTPPVARVVKLMKIGVLPHQLATLLQQTENLPKLVPIMPKLVPKPTLAGKITGTPGKTTGTPRKTTGMPGRPAGTPGKTTAMPGKPADTQAHKQLVSLEKPAKEPNPWYIYVLKNNEVLEELEATRKSKEYAEAAFRCEPCVRTFASAAILKDHAKLHLPSAGPLSCDVCSLRAATEPKLRAHRSLHSTRYRCCLCDYSTPHKHMIEIHACDPEKLQEIAKELKSRRRRPYRYPKPVRCDLCFSRFSDEAALAGHVARLHTEPPLPAKCKVCGKMFKNKYILRGHSYIHKYEGLDALRPELCCKECKIPFSSQGALRTHLASLKHSNKDGWKFECDYCHNKCPNKTAMTLHIKLVHTKELNFKCSQCPRAYVTAGRLLRHEAAHAPGGRPRTHVCDQCGKAFMDKGTLRQHMNIHYGLRPYKCKLCPATFSFSGAVYTHTRLKHHKIKKEWKKKGQKKKKKSWKVWTIRSTTLVFDHNFCMRNRPTTGETKRRYRSTSENIRTFVHTRARSAPPRSSTRPPCSPTTDSNTSSSKGTGRRRKRESKRKKSRKTTRKVRGMRLSYKSEVKILG
ncbi:uncharacterized protein isoform X1 [Choristoneura fumiferana]|uniref:uncharacterized protein isoform X1 n=1 Tax=Choristoneura fumiferana TaxID=7141 RepID=UPI003D15BED0